MEITVIKSATLTLAIPPYRDKSVHYLVSEDTITLKHGSTEFQLDKSEFLDLVEFAVQVGFIYADLNGLKGK